jgi:hypothetical protein
MSHAYIPGRKGDKLTVTVERIDGGKLRCTGPTWSDAVVIYPGEALAFVKIERQGAYPPRQGSRGCDRPPPRRHPPISVDDFGGLLDGRARKPVDLLMNAQQSVCRRAGCYSRTRCWSSGGKDAEAGGKLRVRVPGVGRCHGGAPGRGGVWFTPLPFRQKRQKRHTGHFRHGSQYFGSCSDFLTLLTNW